MRAAVAFLAGFWFLGAATTTVAALLATESVQCVIKSVVVNDRQSVLGTNAVYFLTLTVELRNQQTNAIEIDRDSLAVALNTARLSDTNGVAWEINSPLSHYHFDPLQSKEQRFLRLPANAANQFDVVLTSLDGPFLLVNWHLLGNHHNPQTPSAMSASLFTTVLGRFEGSQQVGKVLLQGASSFSILTEKKSPKKRGQR
jgi:hypothetical protein